MVVNLGKVSSKFDDPEQARKDKGLGVNIDRLTRCFTVFDGHAVSGSARVDGSDKFLANLAWRAWVDSAAVLLTDNTTRSDKGSCVKQDPSARSACLFVVVVGETYPVLGIPAGANSHIKFATYIGVHRS